MNSCLKASIYWKVWFVLTAYFSKIMAQNISTQPNNIFPKIVDFLKSKNDLDFSSVILVTDEERYYTTDSIRNEIFRYLHSTQNNFQLLIIPLIHNGVTLNISNH